MPTYETLPELNRKPGRYYIDPIEFDLTRFKPTATLTGTNNFPRWYRKMKAYLSVREKLGFADGTIKAPARDQPGHEEWKKCDNLALDWIDKSLSPRISQKIKDGGIDNAKQAWKKLKEWYSPGDQVIVLQLLEKIHTYKQVDLSVPKYFAKIISLWQELDILRPPPRCSCGALEIRKKQREDEILGVFLNGLNDQYHGTRARILQKEPLPSPSEACSIIVLAHDPIV